MKTGIPSVEVEAVRVKLSTLWIFIMLNMLFADIFTFMNPGFLKGLITGSADQVQITEGLLLILAVVTEIPIAMVLLSRLLKYRANRWANIIAGTITILYVIGGGSATLHYIFFASLEVGCSALIVWSAWTWANPEG